MMVTVSYSIVTKNAQSIVAVRFVMVTTFTRNSNQKNGHTKSREGSPPTVETVVVTVFKKKKTLSACVNIRSVFFI